MEDKIMSDLKGNYGLTSNYKGILSAERRVFLCLAMWYGKKVRPHKSNVIKLRQNPLQKSTPVNT